MKPRQCHTIDFRPLPSSRLLQPVILPYDTQGRASPVLFVLGVGVGGDNRHLSEHLSVSLLFLCHSHGPRPPKQQEVEDLIGATVCPSGPARATTRLEVVALSEKKLDQPEACARKGRS